MDNCNNENNTILNVLFTSREKIKELIKDNDKYEKVLEFLDNANNDNITKDKIRNSLESYIDGMNIISAYENQKFYEIQI